MKSILLTFIIGISTTASANPNSRMTYDELIKANSVAHQEKQAAQQKLDNVVWQFLKATYGITSPQSLFKVIANERPKLGAKEEAAFDTLMEIVENRNNINNHLPIGASKIEFDITNTYADNALIVDMTAWTGGCVSVYYKVRLEFAPDQLHVRASDKKIMPGNQEIKRSSVLCAG